MAHSVAEAAARAVKNSQRAKVEERTPDEIIKGIRGNIAAHLAVTPTDTAFLLATYDALQATAGATVSDLLSRAETAEAQYKAAVHIITARNHEITELQAKIDDFRSVYEQENRSMAVSVARLLDEEVQAVVTVEGESQQASVVPLATLASEVSDGLSQDHGGEA